MTHLRTRGHFCIFLFTPSRVQSLFSFATSWTVIFIFFTFPRQRRYFEIVMASCSFVLYSLLFTFFLISCWSTVWTVWIIPVQQYWFSCKYPLKTWTKRLVEILKNSSMKHVTKDLKICSKQCIFNLGFSRYNIKKHRWLILMHTTVNLYTYTFISVTETKFLIQECQPTTCQPDQQNCCHY